MNNSNSLGFIPTYDSESGFSSTYYNYDEDKYTSSVETIIINNSQVDPVIQYKKNSVLGIDGKDWIVVDNSDSPNSPAHSSDLDNLLRIRDWNCSPRKFFVKETNGENLYITSEKPLKDPMITVDDEFLKTISIVSDSYNTKDTVDMFNSYYETLLNIKPMNYVYNVDSNDSVNLGSIYYYNLVSSRNLDNGSTIIDLISLNDSNYTNIINLSGLVNIINSDRNNFENYKPHITLGVEFSIFGKRYTKETSFIPFEFVDEKIKIIDFIMDLSNYISVDFHDLCLRVFPKDPNITECIISYCYISYDQLPI